MDQHRTLREKIQLFCNDNPDFSNVLKDLDAISAKDVRQIYFRIFDIASVISDPLRVTSYFKQELLDILSAVILIHDDGDEETFTYDYESHVKNAVFLSKIIEAHPATKSFVLSYFEKYPAPFDDDFTNIYPKNRKKPKLSKDSRKISDYDVVNATYIILSLHPDLFRKKWNWSYFIDMYFKHKDSMIIWLSYKVLGILLNINERHLNTLLDSKLTNSIAHDCAIKYNASKQLVNYPESSTNNSLIVSKRIIDICGIHLQVNPNQISNVVFTNDLVLVDSTRCNLFKVALGVAANKAICLQGSVGTGKTSLVEYLARKTGHILGEDFVKIQLGDQTDSKMLLGTYRCTDIPGEFIWQPGVLTQAVKDGSWILLEDIDSASMDIASVLSGILENGYLTVPGYRDSIPLASGFQLFMTQRLVTTITGHHKKQTNTMLLLEKHIFQVNIDALTTDELVQIIEAQYPVLKTISTRMVSVFQLFARNFTEDERIKMPKFGRMISTRDLFKWCSRSVLDFDVSSQNSALRVLQDAIDIFCSSLPTVEERTNLSIEISTKLGIINEKGRFYCNEYKPNVALNAEHMHAGRGQLGRVASYNSKKIRFCFTRPSACLLERIMCCIVHKEPVLLVGETGTGKTSSLQYLANAVGRKLVVINMNQQSDSADLLGGYKPVDMKFIFAPIKREFENLFCSYFSVEHNKKFLKNINYCFNEQRWDYLLRLMKKSCLAALERLSNEQRPKSLNFHEQWSQIRVKIQKLELQSKNNQLAFSFIEGSLVTAIKNGYWVLLDEINLATAETLECLSGLLEGSQGSLNLIERGDKKPIERDSNFILFACMNPSTDVGKKDLPSGLRNRFTEFFVEELTDKIDLLLLVSSYLDALSVNEAKIDKIVKFYLNVRKEARMTLSDGSGHKPHFSLRSLCRSLSIASKNPCGSFNRSLYEAFCLGFLTQLDVKSYGLVNEMISKYLIGSPKEVKAVLAQPIPQPKGNFNLQFEGYWITKGALEPLIPDDYILTASVRRNLKDLARVVSIGSLPVLLQGDTSVGKTSLITYLAKSSGNKCVRINNHEHTDLQEYVGSYVADSSGRLVFRDGLLVQAMRYGHWIILDELNLAPTDVLEALNRVLDDNRELFIPETQETVKAHQQFMLFATQNPPGLYGGRKMLSRAFRNRFVELHFNEIPHDELEFILHKRCQMSLSYAKKMICVMKDLETRRRGSAAFAGKRGFITLRDLFRWGERYRLAQNTNRLYDWDQHIADEGYLILAGRVRKAEERMEIAAVIKQHIKRNVLTENLFTLSETTSTVTKHILEKIHSHQSNYKNIVWTFNMRQLAVTVSKALEYKEPVLLVGETGGGKTTVCDLLASMNGQNLVTVNCHMHTESSDFIGGLRPVRDHEDLNKLFEWVHGPLIEAMTRGDVFLADEISLADDSVLERLNSLLEPERFLLLAEKGSESNSEELIIADQKFNFIGTMNPGGDFGKKELSPALRNRFTEIWCESVTKRDDLIAIIDKNLISEIRRGMGESIMNFIDWFKTTDIGKRFVISIRDILTWVSFINACYGKIGLENAFLHGASLTFLDSLGSGATAMETKESITKFRNDCKAFLLTQSNGNALEFFDNEISIEYTDKEFGIKPFYIEIHRKSLEDLQFSFVAPTTAYNTIRLLRGLQLNKAILLEGSPGVGKTSLVIALAKSTGHEIFRVNLSDQTDISDLFGADLPVEGGRGGQFSWKDGPLLRALKLGHWILLDELNLASQSVLEGLNACLDHRGEIFIPELGKTFHIKSGTKFFACQNPLKQGGSRRGLPKSFLNRFTQVYISSLDEKDLNFILTKQFPQLPTTLVQSMVTFNARVNEELAKLNFGHKGAPWEFNLRDLTRWCELVTYQHAGETFKPENSVGLIYVDRMRSLEDKEQMKSIFEIIFSALPSCENPLPFITEDSVTIGDVQIRKEVNRCNMDFTQEQTCLLLRNQFNVLRSLICNVNLGWMSLLVGSGSCGKSSVVKTLAQLCGKTLKTLSVTSSMDTTDILGGFEQTDYTRHLEEIVKDFEMNVREIAQKMIVMKSNYKLCSDLLKHWRDCTEYLREETINQTMNEETDLFIKKLSKLNDFMHHLVTSYQNYLDNYNMNRLKHKLGKILVNVQNDKSLNAGGKFEWVDSLLVKCLQEGHWLLIDNVNLCSPAVLDRLNALLEPSGVLTIGERGVDENGKMIEITPHVDFRLFLTMDPKNGEISRAMRNRGLEIYILNEKESGKRNAYDLKSVINHCGLNSNQLIDSLIHIHDYISNVILGEKPNINHLLQSSFLISQQTSRGVDPYEAFSRTVNEVYLKAFTLQESKSTIFAEIELLFATTNKEPFDNHVTMTAKDLQSDSSLANIKQQAVLTVQYQNESMFPYFLMHFYALSSQANKANLSFRTMYLNRMIRNAKGLVLLELFDKTTGNFVDQKAELAFPIDCRWLLPNCSSLSLNNKANTLYLMLHFVSHKHLYEPEGNAEFPKKGLKEQVTILQYIFGVKNKRIETKMDNCVVKYLGNLLELFDEYLLGLLSVEISNATLIEVMSLVRWRFVLYEYMQRHLFNVKGKNFAEIMANLHVHYKWFAKHSIKGVGNLLSVTEDKTSTLVGIINEGLSADNSVTKKLGKNYKKSLKLPPPLVNDTQIDLATKTAPIFQQRTLHDQMCNFQETLKVFCNNSEFRSSLIDLKFALNYDYKTVPDCYASLAATANNQTNKPMKMHDVIILPLIDYFVLLRLQHSWVLPETFKTFPTVPFVLIGVLNRFNQTDDQRLMHELTTEFCDYKLNAAALNCYPYTKYGAVEEDVDEPCLNLALHMPVLTFLITELLVDNANSAKIHVKSTLYGNYRDSATFHGKIKTILWNNMLQLSDPQYLYVENECKYIMNRLITFLEDLGASLNMPLNLMPEEKFWFCIAQIKNVYEKFEFADRVDDKDVFVTILQELELEFGKFNEESDVIIKLDRISNVYILLNLVKSLLNSKLPMIDRLAKIKFKKNYAIREKENLEAFLQSFKLQNEIYSNSHDTLHPLCNEIVRKIDELKNEIDRFGKYVAVRPDNLKYTTVIKTIAHGFSFVISGRRMLNLYNAMKLHQQPNQTTVNNAKSIETSLQNFINSLKNYRYLYPDIIEPLLCNVMELLYGLKLKISVLEKALKEQKYGKDVQENVVNLVKFPNLNSKFNNYESIAESYVSHQMQELIGGLLESEDTFVTKKCNYKLLLCAIQEIYNVCLIDGYHSKISNSNLFNSFNKLIKLFVKTWCKQEEEREIKKQEEESLYKTRTKCDLTDEDEINADFKRLFPNYHDKDFADLNQSSLSNDEDENSENELLVEGDRYKGLINYEDVRFVSELHSQYVRTFTKSEWLNPEKSNLPVDFVKPLLEKYNLFTLLLDKMVGSLNCTVDGELIGSLNVLSEIAQNYGQVSSFEMPSSPSRRVKNYDFYKDSNVDEVKSSFHILEELKVRICELLDEWPEHPNLQTISTIISRIYSFDITSPVSRFLTALEILLTKCNDWEMNAHSGVSLQLYLHNITQQIIKWRKMEMSMWKNLLNTTFTRMNEPITKWWFYIYKAIEEFMHNDQETVEFLQTIRKFVMQSNLAEFENRLELLFTFHCHVVHLKPTKRTEVILNVLWNVHQYYVQFLPSVQEKIKNLRAPIEKKLKDYVKIVRWKDINYWAIKETLMKTHKTLHKQMREFQEVLNQPVLQLLCTVTTKTVENSGIWDRPQRQSPKSYHYSLEPSMYISKKTNFYVSTQLEAIKTANVVSENEKFYKKCRVLCRVAITKTDYPKLIQTVDAFIGGVIESVEHFQKLEVDRTLTKIKQKSQAKSFLTQKQRGLTELFQKLTKMGLSFKTGIVQSRLRDHVKEFLMKPIDLTASFSHLSYCRNDEKILTIWEGCEMFYSRSLVRLNILEQSLKNPSKELSIQMIERCKGFAFYLMEMVHEFKSKLITNTRNLYYLRYYCQSFNELHAENDFIQRSLFTTIESTLKHTLIVMEQFKIILQSAPNEPAFNEEFLVDSVPILPTSSKSKFIDFKHDETWNKTSVHVTRVTKSIEKVFLLFSKNKTVLPSTSQKHCFDYVPISDRTVLQNEFQLIVDEITGIQHIFGNIPVTESLEWILGEIALISTQLQEFQQPNNNDNDGRINGHFKGLSRAVLLVIETIYKKYAEKVDCERREEEEEIELVDGHLTNHIVENLQDDISKVDLTKVLKYTKLIANSKQLFVPSTKPLLTAVLPLMDQLSLLYEYFVTQQVSAYRTMGKLNSILLNVFIELATNGFCTPPDLAEENEVEGEGKPSGGMGLGDGEGQNDVSDKIESEDQLEDAQQPGQEKANEDDDKDVKEEGNGIEMSEDFDSKLQDVEKDDNESDNDSSDGEEQMGDTEKDAEQLDQQIWGTDDEDDNDSGDEDNKEEKGNKGEKEGEQQMAAKEDGANKGEEEHQDVEPEKEKKKDQRKDINEMDEPELDDNQVDPYHGNQPELPEPEPMDLPDDLQLDDGNEKDEAGEENPFDIDAMKEDNLAAEEEQGNSDDKQDPDNSEKNDDEAHSHSESEPEEEIGESEEAEVKESEQEINDTDESQSKGKEDPNEPPKELENKENEDDAATGLDPSSTKDDKPEAMDANDLKSTDNVQNQPNDKRSDNQVNEDVVTQEDNPDQDGAGQSQMEESKTGHQGSQANAQQQERNQNDRNLETKEKRQRPGESDVERSLGDTSEPVKKKLKSMNVQDSQREEEGSEETPKAPQESDIYQHIKEAKTSDEQILDTATKEQVEQQKDAPNVQDKEDEALESNENLPKDEESEEDVEMTDVSTQNAEKLEGDDTKISKKIPQHPEGEVLEEIKEMEIEGEVIDTMTVTRGKDTTHHTHYDLLEDATASKMSLEQMNDLRNEVEQQLAVWHEAPTGEEAEKAWNKISSVTLSLAQDLAEQLRLVLEPTQASRLKGDFRTGRRINMRKVIPYIASQFRKDKIWLRRTKPSKRDYQIVLAIDDSSSMADNHSKELAFESVSLISKALSILESGQLSVISFGETTEVLHKLEDTFTEGTGAKLLQKFQFSQQKTCVGKLVDFANEMLNSQGVLLSGNAKLLIIISDGRGIFSEGESYVRQAVRRAKLGNVFMIFVIVDNPENKNSILDIRAPIFVDGKIKEIKSYLDTFPFPFYIILRDINSLPSVLSDALRQWFEIVTNLDV